MGINEFEDFVDEEEYSSGGDEHSSDDSGGDEESGKKRKIPLKDEKKAKIAKMDLPSANLLRVPTSKELSSLKETQLLYHSNFFRMQMEELNKNISMKEKQRVEAEMWISKFKTFCSSMKKSSPYDIDDISWAKEMKVKVPFANSPPIGKGKFMFIPPSDISSVGSFKTLNNIKVNPCIDIMMTIPSECVAADDWQNARWVRKRGYYLTWLAAHLCQQVDLVETVEWTTQGGHQLRPILQVTPSGSIGKKWKFNLFAVPPLNHFKLNRFAPNKNCVRPAWFLNDDSYDEKTLPATPFYNWLCAMDVVMPMHQTILFETFKNTPNLSLGLKLIKTWTNQQQLNRGIGRFLNHCLSLYLIHLLDTNKLNRRMSGYQIFRTMILSLTQDDWTCGDSNFHEHYSVVFRFRGEEFNVAGFMDQHLFTKIQYEAKLALDLLDDVSAPSFEALFIQKKEFIYTADQIIHINFTKEQLMSLLDKYDNKTQIMVSTLGNPELEIHSKILTLLKNALGERIKLLFKKMSDGGSWSIKGKCDRGHYDFTCGFILDPDSATSLLTKGPSVDHHEECAAFKRFWGDKSTLRRFQDGTFHECVLWGEANKNVGTRRLIPGRIAKYIIHQYLGVDTLNILFICGKMEALLKQRYNKMISTGEEETKSCIQTYDSLARKLRSIDLPLSITSIQSISDVTRHAAVFPPCPASVVPLPNFVKKHHMNIMKTNVIPTYIAPIDVLIFLEISGKWPDDLKAIKALKIEFYVKVAEQLRLASMNCKVQVDHMLVHLNGYTFRLKICNRREIYLHKLVNKPDSTDYEEKDTPTSLLMEKQIEILPKICSALASIQSSHPSYNGAVRLAKRWISAQLLSDHLPDLSIELIVANLYTSSAPYTAPHTPYLGFLRFINTLVATDWNTTPLFVNLNNSFEVEDEAEILKRFNSTRESLPAMFITTPYEIRGNIEMIDASAEDIDKRYRLLSSWTKSNPTNIVLHRIKQIASATLKHFQENMFSQYYDFNILFRPSLKDFDIIINLRQNGNSKRDENVDFNNKVKLNKISTTIPVIDFDPVNIYVNQIKELYKNIGLIFYDNHGGDKIGIVWKPDIEEPTPLKINHLRGHQIYGVKEKKQVVNIDKIIDTLKILGDGLVNSIATKSM